MRGGRGGRGRGRDRFVPNPNNATVNENDQNRANEAPAPENTEEDFIKIWQLARRLRDVHKRQPQNQEEAEQMALDACKAAYNYTKELRKWTRSDPAYCHVLTCIAPRVIATLGCSLTRASTQALEHDGKGFKSDFRGGTYKGKHVSKRKRDDRIIKQTPRLQQAVRRNHARKAFQQKAHAKGHITENKSGTLRVRPRLSDRSRSCQHSSHDDQAA